MVNKELLVLAVGPWANRNPAVSCFQCAARRWSSPLRNSNRLAMRLKSSSCDKLFVTYPLGRSLYVPLTVRTHTQTLPQTRGPNFRLPVNVVRALLNLRRLEASGQPEEVIVEGNDDGYALLPPPDFDPVGSLSVAPSFNAVNAGEDGRHPTVDFLVNEVQSRLVSDGAYDAIVIAGEGEPTLRLVTLLELVRKTKILLVQGMSHRSAENTGEKSCAIRVVTNGLVDPSAALELKDAGVTSVSVALMTWDADQYDEIMKPCLANRSQTPYSLVCSFIREAVRIGLDVEATAVARPDVYANRMRTEALATEIGITRPVRWRSFFP